MNCISWIIDHLAWHEQINWLTRAQGNILAPRANELAGYGKPASTPPLDEMWQDWQTITQAADTYLDTLISETLLTHLTNNGRTHGESIGSTLYRMIYHYWYHIGEGQAIRQMLGHTGLPEFIGSIHNEAPYVPETQG